jgi:hypothetical protein
MARRERNDAGAKEARSWTLTIEARTGLERLEAELTREEFAPFDRRHRETWIRSALSP